MSVTGPIATPKPRPIDALHGYERSAPCARKPRGREWLYRGIVLRDPEPRHGYVSGPLGVISSIIDTEMPDGRGDTGLQWLVSVTYNAKRATDKQVRRALRAFGMVGSEEDNHHPGHARAFFLVVDPSRRVDCQCKTDEQVIVEPDGFTWSNPRPDGGEPCRGCSTSSLTGLLCPLHMKGT